ncbi:hypothetical protein BZG36_02538 [Bifiguratus adelaidae]|uniref:Beta-galactosidase domain-containing protein n=1 Tax=Bifiguratus adelaidae TaxID=1938954 RepID=A0A261Y269_9FUNG|nr:hypothetical protein BZG36_02538 [Bifiguratus adelaidae]
MAGTKAMNCSTSVSGVQCDKLYNEQTLSEFYILRNKNISGFDNFDFKLNIDNSTAIPVQDTIAIHGRDSKLLSVNLQFLDQHILYSTSEVLTWGTIDDVDYLVLHGLEGEDAEISLRTDGASHVKVHVGSGSVNYTLEKNSVRLNIRHQVLEVGNKPWSGICLWQLLLHLSQYLLRGETKKSDHILSLRGDAAKEDAVEVFASSRFTSIEWNDKRLHVSTSSRGSRIGKIAGPKSVVLPKLQNWYFARESPESLPSFDDRLWKNADKTSTNNPLPQPSGQPVLYASDYGYHIGHIWYRGHFEANGVETAINITAQGKWDTFKNVNFFQTNHHFPTGGENSIYSCWLNGHYLGSSNSSGNGSPHVFQFSNNELVKGKNVISVLVDGMGSDEEGGSASDLYKNYRGLREAHLLSDNGSENVTISWKIQGNLGGEDIVDTARGTFNVGGKYGERHGWHLPKFPLTTRKFKSGITLPHNFGMAGIVWYMTEFELNFPENSDNPLVVVFDMPKDQSYRAEFYINGWNYGKVIPELGPQDEFPVPPGILNTNGKNRLAIAVLGIREVNNTFGDLRLKVLNSYVFSGKLWTQTEAPDFDEKVYGTSSGW